MSDLAITAEWIEAEELQGAELRSTWCALSIRAGDSFPTRVLSRRSRTVRDTVFIPAYPLAEWIATSWWLLFEQRENPVRSARRSFQETHSLRFARDGYALPDLTIVSLGDTCRLRWVAGPLNPYDVEFLNSGSVTLPTSTVRSALGGFVDQVVSRLLDSGIEDTLLQEEWQSIRELEAEEADYCVALASVGLDPFSAEESEAATVLQAHASLPESLVRELSGVADGAELGPAALKLSAILHDLETTTARLLRLAKLKAVLQAPVGQGLVAAGTPWSRGYADARALRAELGLNGAPIASLGRLGELLGEEPSDVDEVVRGRAIDLPLVHGVASTGDDGSLALRLAPTHPQSTLFHFTRALGSYLFSPDRATALTRASSDVQARFRAFAAEFLAPASGLSAAVSGETVDQEEVDNLAVFFGVSPFVIHHQLQNHRIADTFIELTDVMPDA